jgi:3-oxoacyl-[acyl-carrier protein] reductase
MTDKRSERRPAGALRDQVAVVTGAARGIGEAIANRLAGLGATVILTARDQAQLTQVRPSSRR